MPEAKESGFWLLFRKIPDLWFIALFKNPICNIYTVDYYLQKSREWGSHIERRYLTAVTNGIFVRFGNAENCHGELLSMAEREH